MTKKLVNIVLLCLLCPLAGLAAEGQVMHGHVPKVLSHLSPAGRLEAARHLDLAIILPLRNQATLTELLRQLQDPMSPNYRHYLTPAQFTERFGPSQQDYEAVAAFAQAHGLAVTHRHPNRLVMDVDGTVSDIEKTLHVTMRVYQHPTEPRTFYAPDVEPSPDLTVQIAHIGGLDDFSLPHPNVKGRPLNAGIAAAAPLTPVAATPAGLPIPNTGSWDGLYIGNDFRAAYAQGVTLTGSGQSVGLLEFTGYTASDITMYESQAGLPNVPLTNVLLDGVSGAGNGGDGQLEVSLDIEVAIAMAPGLSSVIVYEGGSFYDIFNRMATDNLAKQLSSSWTSDGGANGSTDAIFEEMAAQGQSFYQASGDGDAYTGLIEYPVDSPYLTAVGGTELYDNGTGGSWNSESVWNWGGGTGSSGGISTQYSMPAWQQGISMMASQGSATARNVPDVAMCADNVYVVMGGGGNDVGGTSCAAPLWAGFTALINQQAVANGRNTAGFINPAVYALASSSAYASTFHDVTTGANTPNGGAGKFQAVTGYDLCTGLGSPTGAALINALAQAPDNLQVSFSSFLPVGHVGGPFSPSSNTYKLTNTGASSLTWSASATPSWLSLSATGGTIAASGSATVTASINSNANALTAGTTSYLIPYNGAVTFTDIGTSYSQSRAVTLTATVNQILSSITVAPVAGITAGQTQQLTATAYDQFGALMLSQPSSYTWAVASGGGSVSSSGLYTSPGAGTLATVTAMSGTVTGTGTVPVVSVPWISADIGSPALMGSAYNISGTFTVAGQGSGFYGTADQLHYVYQTLGGDGMIMARVASQQNTSGNADAGVMIRNSTADNDQAVMMFLDSNGNAYMQYRNTLGGNYAGAGNTNGIAAPYWLKLVRSGNTFTGYISANGTSWTEEGTTTIAMGTSVLIGLGVSSGASVLNTSTFDNVALLAATGTSIALPSSGSATVNVLNNVTAPSGATLSVSAVTLGAYGTVVNNGNGTVTYTTTTLGLGADTFTYTISDGLGDTATATVGVAYPGLQAEWKFNDGAGVDAADSTGNGNTGTLYYGPTWTTGTLGGALAFTGSENQYVSAPVSNISETSYAVSFWFKTITANGGLYDVYSNTGGYDRDIYLSGGNLSAYVYNVETISTSGLNLADGNWHQVVHTFGGVVGAQKLYVDGVLQASGIKSLSNFTWPTDVHIGYAAYASTPYFTGTMEDVRLYNMALSGSAAADIYAGHDSMPTVAAAAAASPNPTTSHTTSLSALGGSTYGASTLTYTWAVTSLPGNASAPTFSPNGTNAAQNSIATFTSSGTYVLNVTITDAYGLSTVSSVSVSAAPTLPGQLAWTGTGGNSNWSNGANWVGGWTPPAGEQLLFNGSATDDLSSGSAFGGLSLQGSNITLGGNSITLTSGTNTAIASSGTNNSISQAIQLGSNAGISLGGGSLIVSGAISGPYGLTVSGPGVLTLAGANTYTGVTTLTSGTLTINGSIAGSNVVFSGAGTINGSGSMIFSGTAPSITDNAGGTSAISGVTIASGTGSPLALTVSSGDTLALTGEVWSGTSGILINGAGTITDSAEFGLSNASLGGAWTMTNGTYDNTNTSGNENIGLNGNGTWTQSGGASTFNDYLVAGGGSSGIGQIMVSGGTFTQQTNGGLYLGNTGATGTVTVSGSGTVSIQGGSGLIDGWNAGGTGAINVNGGTFTVGAVTSYIGSSGSGSFTQTSGTSTFGENIYGGLSVGSTGQITVSGGSFSESVGNFDLGVSGDCSITISGNASVSLASGVFFILGQTVSTSAGTVNMNGGIFNSTYTGNQYIGYGGTGTWTQTSGTATFSGYAVLGGIGSASSANGQVSVSGGSFTTAAFYLGAGGSGTLTVSGSGSVTAGYVEDYIGASTVNLNGGTLTVGYVARNTSTGIINFNGGTLQPSGSTTTFVQGLTTANVLAGGAVINTNGFNDTIAQALLSGTTNDGGLTKNGTGTLTLTGSNTYTGATTINAGALAVNGSIHGPVTVNSGATLSGTGKTGAVTVAPGGDLAPGISGTGLLSLNGNALSLSGSTAIAINAATGNASTAVQGVTNITYGGTLNVTNLSGTLALGNSFTLFSAATYSGSFATINLPALGSGLAWNTSNLAVNGSISVVSFTQVLTTITVAPATASLTSHGMQQFTATGYDQNSNPMVPQPTFTWSNSGVGSVNASGLYTGSYASGAATVMASSGSVSGSASVTVTDVAPTVTTAAAASPSTVTGNTTALSVSATGESTLTYTWAATSIPSGATAPTYSANGTTAAQNTTATFGKAGAYTFTVTITDMGGLSTTSTTSVTVNQTFTSMAVTPATASVDSGQSQQFTATGNDQFGNSLSSQPTFTWSLTGTGSVNSSGLYTASYAAGTASVTASSGTFNASASVTVTNTAPTVVTSASAAPNPLDGPRANLSVLGADSNGNPASTLTYTWAATTIPSGAATPTFSANGTNAAQNSQVSVTATGAYTFTATITDEGGAITTSSCNVTVNQLQFLWTGTGGNLNWSNGSNWNGGLAPEPGDQLIFTGSASDDYAAGTAFTSIGLQGSNIGLSGSSFTLTSGTSIAITNSGTNNAIAQAIQLGSNATVSAASGVLTVSGAISGTSGLTETGTGTLVLMGSDTYTGATTVNAGVLTLGIGGSLPDTSTITIATGATLNLSGNANNQLFLGSETGAMSISGTLDDTTNYAHTLYASAITLNNGAITSTGGGAGQAAIYGAYFFNAGFTNTIAASGSNNTISGNGGVGIYTGATLTLDTPMTTDALIVSSTLGYGTSGSGGGLTKSGSGTVTLTAANLYTGATTVSAGTLQVLGSIGSSAVTVNSGATLSGTGTTGAVTINAGGTLAPGVSGTGSLGLNGKSMSLFGATALSVSASTGTGESVQGISTATYGGTLNVTNLAGSFAAGNVFTLFSASTYSGSFSTIYLPSLSSGLSWNTADLSVNGSIIVTGSLPSGWNGSDIGAVGVPGYSAYSGTTYTVAGSGAGIGGTADAFQYVSQTLTGDGDVRAQVTSQTNTGANAMAGVMIRSGSGAGALNAIVALTPASKFIFQSRATVSGTTATSGTAASYTAPNNWVRLTRSGTLISAYVSNSGTAWTQIGSVVTTMTNSVSVGLAVTSASNTTASTATFTNVSVTPFPSPWQSLDIGSPGQLGSAEYYNGAYTLKGAGNIGSTADKFHFVYQSVSGTTGTLSAQISSLQNTGTNSAIGVMIRSALTTNSIYAFMGVSGSGSFETLTRSSTGGSTTKTTSGSGTAPNLWVKIVKSGNGTTLSGYESTSGTSWTLLKSTTISTGSNIYIGMADASGTTSTLNTSVFSNMTFTP